MKFICAWKFLISDTSPHCFRTPEKETSMGATYIVVFRSVKFEKMQNFKNPYLKNCFQK